MPDLALELLEKHKKPIEDAALELLKKHKKPTEDVALELLKKHKKPHYVMQKLSDEEFMKGGELVGEMPEVTVTAPREKSAYDKALEIMKGVGEVGERAIETIQKPVVETVKKAAKPLGEPQPETLGEKVMGVVAGLPFEIAKRPAKWLQIFYHWEERSKEWEAMIKSPFGSKESKEAAKRYIEKEKWMRQKGLTPESLPIELTLDLIWVTGMYSRMYTKSVVKQLYGTKQISPKELTAMVAKQQKNFLGNQIPTKENLGKATEQAWAHIYKTFKKHGLGFKEKLFGGAEITYRKPTITTTPAYAEAAAIKAIAKPGATAHDLRNIVIPKAPVPPTEQALLPSSVPAAVHDIIDKQRILQGSLLSATKELRELTPGTASYIKKATAIKQIEKDMHKVVIEIGKEYKLPKEAEKVISEIDGNMDLLSEVYNRARFSRDLANNYVKGNFLTFADVDDFKIFNNKYGHIVGDQVVESIGKGIKESLNKLGLSKEVIPYRFGGDEFVMVSKKSLTTDQIKEINISINETFKKLQPDVEENIKISWGEPVLSKDCKNPSDWIDTADKEMYRVKQAAKEMKPPEEPPTGAVPVIPEPTPPTKPPAEKDVALELLEKHKKPELEMKAKEVKIEKPAPKVTQTTITGKPYIPPKDVTGVEVERQKMEDMPLFEAAGEKGAEQLRLGTQKPPEDLERLAKAAEDLQRINPFTGEKEILTEEEGLFVGEVEGKAGKYYSPIDGEEISKEDYKFLTGGEADLWKDIEEVTGGRGIRSYKKVAGEKPLREEFLEVPIHLRNKNGLPLDEVADLMRKYKPQWGVEGEADLITLMHNYKMGGGMGMEMGFVRLEPIIKAYTTVHDWMFTHGEMRRVDPQMYDQLMLRFSRYNAAVEKATSKADEAMMKQKVTPFQKMEMAIIYEDKTYNPRPEYREVYNNLAKLNQAIERASLRKGIIERPFQERMIEEHEKEIQLLRQERITPEVTARIEELSAEIEKFKNMRYLPHQIVVKRAIEAKLNRLTGEEKKIFIDKLTRLSGKFHIRKGKKLLQEYFDEGILTTKDVDFVKLTIDNLNSYYQKSAMKDLYDVATKKGYIQPMSKRLLDEGWYKSDEVGIIAPELKRKVIHPLFANALNEIKALKLGSRGNIARQVFGAVKVAQFIKPSIIWVYDGAQKVIRGTYSLNPIREIKFAAKATHIVLTANAKYHQLNKLNLYQFPAETPRAVKEEMIKMAVRKADATIPGWVKILEKITNTSWAKGDISPTDLLMLPYRTLANLTWTGDKIIRTSSVLALEKMGYPTEEAVQIAARGHGAYSELSPQFKKVMAPLFFVHSFRVLMPMEIAKVLTDPVREILQAKFSAEGKKIPKHKIERMAKAIIGTILIPIIAEIYMRARGFEKDKLMWKWRKVVTDPDTGKKAEVVVTLNNIINMPVKWLHRLTYYNPIDPTPRGLQGIKNWYKWEAHPLTRIFFWDILENRRSFGDMEQVFDPNTNFLNKHWQIAKYVFGQAFRFHGLALEAVDAGNLTLKEKKDQEKCLDLALSDFEKVLFGKHLGVLGYAYVRQNKQKQGQIWTSVLLKEFRKRLFNLLIKYEEGPERDKAEQSIHHWFKKCQLWIEKTFSYDFKSHKEPEPKKDEALELLEKHKK